MVFDARFADRQAAGVEGARGSDGAVALLRHRERHELRRRRGKWFGRHRVGSPFADLGAKVDAGYRGLAKQFPDQVQAPPPKPGKDAKGSVTKAAYNAIGQRTTFQICVTVSSLRP